MQTMKKTQWPFRPLMNELIEQIRVTLYIKVFLKGIS